MLDWVADLRGNLGPSGDQGRRGTCLAWATTSARTCRLDSTSDLSVEYLHWATGRYPDGRGQVASVAQALRHEGQPPSSQWPYDQALDDSSTAYEPPAAVVGPFEHAEVRAMGIEVSKLLATLAAGDAPVLILGVTDAFLSAEGGIVVDDGPGRGLHAVLVVGAATVRNAGFGWVEPESRMFCVRNSWGRDWGVDGHALMSAAAVASCGRTTFTLDPSGPEAL